MHTILKINISPEKKSQNAPFMATVNYNVLHVYHYFAKRNNLFSKSFFKSTQKNTTYYQDIAYLIYLYSVYIELFISIIFLS